MGTIKSPKKNISSTTSILKFHPGEKYLVAGNIVTIISPPEQIRWKDKLAFRIRTEDLQGHLHIFLDSEISNFTKISN